MLKRRFGACILLAVSILLTFGTGAALANTIGAGGSVIAIAYTDMDHGTAPALTVDHSQNEGTDFWFIPIVHRSYSSPTPAKISRVLVVDFTKPKNDALAFGGKHEVGWRKTA